jgi:hypothetical protein
VLRKQVASCKTPLKNSHSHRTSIKQAEKTFEVEEHQRNKSIMTSSTEATATALPGRRESLSLEEIMEQGGEEEEEEHQQQQGNWWPLRSRSFVEAVPAVADVDGGLQLKALAHGGNKLIGSLWTSMGAATEWFTHNDHEQQQQLQIAADRNPNMNKKHKTHNNSRSGTNNNRSNTNGGTAKRWLFADSMRALCTRTTRKRQSLGTEGRRSFGLTVDEITAIRNEIAKTRQAVHEAIGDMELGAEDWKKLQRTLRVMNHRTFTNEGAKIALGQLIVDASLAENKPVNPRQTHHRRGDRRTYYEGSKKISKSSIRERHLMPSMYMSSIRHHPHGNTSSSHGPSLAYSATCPSRFDADQHHDPEELFTVQDLLRSASTRKMEALYFADEYGVDQRHPKSQDSSMNNSNSSLNSSWNELDMRLSQLSHKHGVDGPAWIVVERTNTNSNSSSADGSSHRRANFASSQVNGTSFAERAYDALSRTAVTLASRGTTGFHDSYELLSETIDELDEEEESSSCSFSNDHTIEEATRRRRGALTGASKDEVKQQIAIDVHSTRTDKNNCNINKLAVQSDFADFPLRLQYANDGREMPGARGTLEMLPFASIPNQNTMRARDA